MVEIDNTKLLWHLHHDWLSVETIPLVTKPEQGQLQRVDISGNG